MAGRGLPPRRATGLALLQPRRRSQQSNLRYLMRLSVTHETRYRYSSPVVLSQQLLHLTPRVLPWQRCDAHEVRVEPTASETTQREDYYGNRTVSLVIAVPHQELVARAASARTPPTGGSAACARSASPPATGAATSSPHPRQGGRAWWAPTRRMPGLRSIAANAPAGSTSTRRITASSTMPTSRSAGGAISPTSRRCAA